MLKLIHHKHSGKLRPHEHTSYGPLGVLLLVVGLLLGVYTSYAASPGPQAGSIGLSGIVPGKPPSAAPTIDSPRDGAHFSTTPVAVSGTCPKNTLVEAGPLTSLDFGGAQLLLNTDAVFRGVFPEQEMNVPIDILGGTPPYAINVQWGDSSNKVVPRGNNQSFTIAHVYSKAGTYQMTIQGSDANGRVAFLTVAAIVNGQPSVATGDTSAPTVSNSTLTRLLTLWPLYASVVGIAVSFWLGERREKHLILRAGPVYHT
jgi:hypothetical protein